MARSSEVIQVASVNVQRVFPAEHSAGRVKPMVLASDQSGNLVVSKQGETPMLFNLVDPLARPEAYVCLWRDGELYIEPILSAEVID
jgi:hypothetical protein